MYTGGCRPGDEYLMVTLWAIVVKVPLEEDGRREGGGGPIQEALGRSCWSPREVGQWWLVEASRRVSMVSCWSRDVSREMRLDT